MLIHNKRVFTFTFIFENEKYKVIYTKEYNPNFDDIINDIEVMGNINSLTKVIEILEDSQNEISEELENNLELEEIYYNDLWGSKNE